MIWDIQNLPYFTPFDFLIPVCFTAPVDCFLILKRGIDQFDQRIAQAGLIISIQKNSERYFLQNFIV